MTNPVEFSNPSSPIELPPLIEKEIGQSKSTREKIKEWAKETFEYLIAIACVTISGPIFLFGATCAMVSPDSASTGIKNTIATIKNILKSRNLFITLTKAFIGFSTLILYLPYSIHAFSFGMGAKVATEWLPSDPKK